MTGILGFPSGGILFFKTSHSHDQLLFVVQHVKIHTSSPDLTFVTNPLLRKFIEKQIMEIDILVRKNNFFENKQISP